MCQSGTHCSLQSGAASRGPAFRCGCRSRSQGGYMAEIRPMGLTASLGEPTHNQPKACPSQVRSRAVWVLPLSSQSHQKLRWHLSAIPPSSTPNTHRPWSSREPGDRPPCQTETSFYRVALTALGRPQR